MNSKRYSVRTLRDNINYIQCLLVNVEDKRKLDEFLEARNPKQDPTLTLQSLLTKPVLVSDYINKYITA